MDDRARREEKSDNRSHLAVQANETEQRNESPARHERVNERPPLTLRESREPWPIG
jgi:hypothetical protein